MGEITVHAEHLTLLSKSLRPLPIVKMKDGVAYDAFTDPEQRYRRRYVEFGCQQRRHAYLREAHQDVQLHAQLLQLTRLHGGRDTYPAIHPRWRCCSSLHHSPQRIGYTLVSPHRR